MKIIKLFVISLLLLATTSLKAQTYVEAVYGNEDKSIGADVIIGRLVIGAENGVYKYNTRYKIEHQKYKLGAASIFDMRTANYTSSFILFAAACYNDYNEIYNDGLMEFTPKWSAEFGVKTNFSDNIFVGFNYDVVHKTGSWTIGFMLID